jgi:hypothetical protein
MTVEVVMNIKMDFFILIPIVGERIGLLLFGII